MRSIVAALTVLSALFILSSFPAHASSSAENVKSSTQEADASFDGACTDDTPGLTDPVLVGKPVNLLTGAESFSRTDLTIGRIYPLTIRRQYSSGVSYDSPAGHGWAHNYDRRIYTYPDGSVTLRTECGRKRRFTLTGAVYTPSSPGETGTLTRSMDPADFTYQYTYQYKSGAHERYDSRGRLVSRSDLQGNSAVIYYELDSRSPLWGLLPTNIDQTTTHVVAYDYRVSRIEEQDASGNLTDHYLLFHYDSSTGRLTDIVDNAGRTVTYSYDGIGNLISTTGPAGNAAYAYTDAEHKHRITSINEGRGEYANTYDSQGRVIKQTHGTGVIDIAYTAPGKTTTVTTTIKDSTGTVQNTRTRIVTFDTNGQPAQVTDTFGTITTYVRDSNARLIQEGRTDIATGTTITTVYTYNAVGSLLSKTEALGTPVEKTTTYEPIYNKAQIITKSNVVIPAMVSTTTNSYSPVGNLLFTTRDGFLGDGTPFSYTTTYTYDSNGKLTGTMIIWPGGQDETNIEYDPAGNITKIILSGAGATRFSDHDPLGNPRTVTGPNGNVTTYTYDAIGRITSIKAPGDTNAAQYYYSTWGCPSCGTADNFDHIILPEGNRIDFGYDTQGNLTLIKDSQNNTLNYTYDSEGNRLSEQIKNASGTPEESASYTYDALNRLKKIISPDSTYTEYSYDFQGNKSAIRNPNSAITSYTYDALNRLKSIIQPVVAPASAITTTFGYNTNNNLTTVQDANNTTTYKYDDAGRVYQVISPDTGTTTYTYDPVDNMTGKTDAKGVTITYEYDAPGRLTKIDYPGDTDTVFGYDNPAVNGIGRLCSITDTSGTTNYEYTPKGQISKETTIIDSITYVTRYTYDQDGNVKTMTYPSGKVITYNYTNDRVTSVQNNAMTIATNIQYKPFGPMTSVTYGNGITTTIAYDTQYRIATITTGTNQNTYGYDNNGNITSIAPEKTFSYDALDRLTSGIGLWGSLAWTYDGVGNRLTENTTNYSYVANSNKLDTVNGMSFSYDNNGNTTTEGAKQYIYNQNQRLIQVNNGAVTAIYTYNGSGQRVKKVVNGTTTIFHYSLSGQLIAESNSAGNITAEYVYLNGQPLVKLENTNTYYYHNDHLGTPQKMTDGSGVVVWAADYKPFGEVTITVSMITNNLVFPGQYRDAETGLYQNGFRDYNVARGGYTQADPIGLKGGVNLYAYVGNNPINLIDPYGLQASSGTGSCQPKKSCQEQADEAYNNCMAGMSKGVGGMSTVQCIGTSVGVGIGLTALTRNPIVGIVGGGIGVVYCVSNVGPNTAQTTGEGYCKMLSNRILTNCLASGQ